MESALRQCRDAQLADKVRYAKGWPGGMPYPVQLDCNTRASTLPLVQVKSHVSTSAEAGEPHKANAVSSARYPGTTSNAFSLRRICQWILL